MAALNLQTFALTRVLARPPVTPPYLLLAFFVTCVAAACYELVLGVLREGEGPGYVALGLGALQLCVLGGLIWTAGTYPLGQYWPGPNVARPFEVSSFVYCAENVIGLMNTRSEAPLEQVHDAGRQRGLVELDDVLVC